MKHLNIVIDKKQNVKIPAGFLTLKAAYNLNVKGVLKNNPDQIIIEAEGTEGQMARFIKWINDNLSALILNEITISESKLKNYNEFDIY